jgi:hypothetical protein
LQAINRRLIDLLGDDYAINFDNPHDFKHEGKPYTRFETRCVYFTHNNKGYDENPDGWIGVGHLDGSIISGCWVCERMQVIRHKDELQPAPTLLTLSRNDKRLLEVLVALGCNEVYEVNGKTRPAVAFPVVYSDGTQGCHYRVALEGKDKWHHQAGGKAKHAVFALHIPIVRRFIEARRFVIVTESPLDAATLLSAGYPAIAVLGKGNADAFGFDLHRETLHSILGDDGVVYVWQETDAAGFAQQVANALQRTVKVINPTDYAKDAYRIWLNCGKDWGALKSVVRDLLDSATEIAPQSVTVPKIVRVGQHVEVAWKPLGEITMPQNDQWQVEGLIKEGNLVILSARPKTAKSIVALNLAACIAMGKPFLDRSVTQGRALFVAYERHDLTLLRALAMGLADCYDFMLWDKHAWGMPRIESFDLWLEFIDKHGVKLFVVDTLAHYLRPELEKVRNAINAYDHIYKVMERLQSGAVDTGCTFLLIHHDRKGETAETDEARVLGTTALTAAADAVFQLKPMGDGVICLKATGNAFDDTVFYFTIGADNWLELADKPATTKEEKAAKAIEDYLRQQGEATRQDLIRLLIEAGLAGKESAASMLLQRAFDGYLSKRVEKRLEGKQAVYRLKGGSLTLNSGKGNVDVVNRPDPTFNTLNTINTLNNTRHVKGVKGQPDPDLQPARPLTTFTNPIGVAGVKHPAPDSETDRQPAVEVWDYDRVYGDLFDDDDNPPDRPNPQGSPPKAPTRTEGDPQGNLPAKEPDPQPARPEGSLTDLLPDSDEALWVWFLPDRPKAPTRPADDRPAGDPQPAPLPDNDMQPHTVLREAKCPYCEIDLDPEADGHAGCLGCGRLFVVKPDGDLRKCVVVATADWVEDDRVVVVTSDDFPPNGQGGIRGELISAPKLTLPPATLVQRMTARQPDGSIVLEWGDKTEVVAPDDLKGWQDIDAIPEINLPAIENIPIPPTIVLDLETDGLDPKRGCILAAGLALFEEGKEVEAQIIRCDDGEANLLAQVFDWLRKTCNKLGNVILTGYNLLDFDLPYLIERARRVGIKHDCPFRYLKDENGEIKRWKVAATEGTLKGDPLIFPAIVARDLPITSIDTLHLVCRWDYTAKALRNYDLKSVAAHFGVNQPDRPILTPEQILHAFRHDWETFKAYLMADLRETFALFSKLVTPYIAIAALTKLPIDQVVTRSTAWIWQQILHRHYGYIPVADEKQKYKGGLVASRKGLWSPCMKVDIASLYPTIMLAYRIHSRKDTDQIALRWLKTLTRQRLALKAKAKADDANAQILQEAMKILINSLYGFYGTGGYGFNDMTAAERVTCVGRKILAAMIAAVEDAGGIVVETDTDGLTICYRNANPQEILQAVSATIPQPFKVEVEWQEAICFVSDDKNYIVLDANGDIVSVKGSKWRGRDKEAYLTKAIPEFVRLWALEGREAAMAYAAEILDVIRSGKGWRWVVRSHRVGKGDKFLIDAGFKVGDVATYAYRDKKKSTISRQPDEGYDCLHYARQFGKIIKEVIEAVNPEAWRELVGLEAKLI